MIVSFVVLIVALLLFTKIENQLITLVTLGFLSFFFLYLLCLLNVINKPFKVGQERGDDDVSLFLLYEFVVHARSAGQDLTTEQVVEIASVPVVAPSKRRDRRNRGPDSRDYQHRLGTHH